jgi:hypothetical protein
MLFERPPIKYLGVTLSVDQESSDFKLDLKGEYFVHDVRSGEGIGKLQEVSGVLEPGEAKVYSLLPYEVQAISVDLDSTSFQPGDRIEYGVRVDPVGVSKPGDHVFRIEVLDPAGEVAEAHTRNRLSAAGISQEEIRLALNAEKGSWKIVVRDITTGLKTEAAFQVE